MPQQFVIYNYKNDRSIGGKSLKDLKAGSIGGIVGGRWKDVHPRDIVLITATTEHPRNVTGIFGEITSESFPSDLWHKQGGKIWPHNYKYTPLTKPLELFAGDFDKLKELCKRDSLDFNRLKNGHALAGGPYKNDYLGVIKEFLAM